MKKKITELLNRPVTWMDSIKATIIAYLIMAPYFIWVYYEAGVFDNVIDNLKDFFDGIINRFRKD